jgi:hypothetical protein
MGVIKAVRAALAFDKAERCLINKDYNEAQRYMLLVRKIAKGSFDKPRLFSFHLMEARIYRGLNQLDDAASALSQAADSIKRVRDLKEIDRTYLLLFCRLMSSELSGSAVDGEDFRVIDDPSVSPRYRQTYPMVWDT